MWYLSIFLVDSLCLCCINIQIVGSMLTSIRKLKLGREKIEEVLEIAKKKKNKNK